MKHCQQFSINIYMSDIQSLVPLQLTECLIFLPERRYASADLCDSDVSVCLSVRTSVIRRYCA